MFFIPLWFAGVVPVIRLDWVVFFHRTKNALRDRCRNGCRKKSAVLPDEEVSESQVQLKDEDEINDWAGKIEKGSASINKLSKAVWESTNKANQLQKVCAGNDEDPDGEDPDAFREDGE